MAVAKDIKKIVRTIQGWEGWRVEETRNGWVAYPADKTKPPVHFHRSPSDHRWHKNLVADLRRAGGKI